MKPLTIQKLLGIGLIAMAVLVAALDNGDCTLLVFSLFFAIPLIFCRENLIGIEDDYIEEEQNEHKR